MGTSKRESYLAIDYLAKMHCNGDIIKKESPDFELAEKEIKSCAGKFHNNEVPAFVVKVVEVSENLPAEQRKERSSCLLYLLHTLTFDVHFIRKRSEEYFRSPMVSTTKQLSTNMRKEWIQ